MQEMKKTAPYAVPMARSPKNSRVTTGYSGMAPP
jgi:hypothetical protein